MLCWWSSVFDGVPLDGRLMFVIGNLIATFPATFGPSVLFLLLLVNFALLLGLFIGASFGVPPYR